MTIQQLDNIAALRAKNYTYNDIGKKLNIATNTVKSVCRRKDIKPLEKRRPDKSEQVAICQYCGSLLAIKSRRKKLFGTNKCRYDYWNEVRRGVRDEPK